MRAPGCYLCNSYLIVSSFFPFFLFAWPARLVTNLLVIIIIINWHLKNALFSKIVSQAPVTTRKPSLRTVQKSLQWTFETVQWHRWMTQLRGQSVPRVRSRCGERSGTRFNFLRSGHKKLVVVSRTEPRTTWDRGSRHTKSGKVEGRPAVQKFVSIFGHQSHHYYVFYVYIAPHQDVFSSIRLRADYPGCHRPSASHDISVLVVDRLTFKAVWWERVSGCRTSVCDRGVRPSRQPARLPARSTSIELHRLHPAASAGVGSERRVHRRQPPPRAGDLQGPCAVRLPGRSWRRVLGVQVGRWRVHTDSTPSLWLMLINYKLFSTVSRDVEFLFFVGFRLRLRVQNQTLTPTLGLTVWHNVLNDDLKFLNSSNKRCT